MTGPASSATRPPETGTLEEAMRRLGDLAGLDAIGFATPDPGAHGDALRRWWSRGYGGELGYIGRRIEERVDPARVLPGVRSIIVAALLLPAPPETGSEQTSEPGAPRGRIARYAGGDDYHDVLLERLRMVEAALPVLADRSVASRSYVDTGPVLERAAAVRAGLGWMGKNTCLIHPDLGSHLMLGVILCDLDLESGDSIEDHCGTCRACLDVCPTGAFPEPYVLDATRCLSYTTIELRESIPESLRERQGAHVFGCDLCQTVCPWNKSRPRTFPPDPLGLRARLAPRTQWIQPTLAWLLDLDAERFGEATKKGAIRRTGYRGLIRNALVAAGNSGEAALLPAIERYAEGEDELLAEHARWARERLQATILEDERSD